MPRLLAVTVVAALLAPGPPRPRVLGISHIAVRASDATAARAFYEGFLGLRGLVVNARQHVELLPGLAPEQDRLDHIALETDDAAAMRRHLAARGVDVPDRVTRSADGSAHFTVRDPEGHAVEFVQRTARARSKPEPAASPDDPRISRRILHVGIIVGDVPAAMKFYGDVLGLSETWRGSRSGTELSWINMKVPDGSDYVEFMLYGQRPAPNARGTQHHLCLEVADIEAARTLLEARPYRATYTRTLEARVGTNRKRQLNLFDPDGTRTELMEPVTVDGRPTPSSTAPLPARP
jgi:catechol 2,3-dioxygenase-like lactoylglutathione lyase family enzyme